MRGTPTHIPPPPGVDGLIPTYAGNTSLVTVIAWVSRAHPHVCGEHPEPPRPQRNGSGSSPRMRGTRAGLLHFGAATGLIPTYAGNTPGGCARDRPGRAHPHVCGEHSDAALLRREIAGSSPRMRGTRGLQGRHPLNQGLIPTYAGNTEPEFAVWCPAWAHPHVCGEHVLLPTHVGINRGSSPRMRGTHRR